MQRELFGMSGPVVDASKISKSQEGWMDRFRITLRLDHLSILAIAALVLYVLVFSFGVEKGKRFALQELEAERLKQLQASKEFKELTAPETSLPLAATSPSPEVAMPTVASEVTGGLIDRLTGRYTIPLITFTSRPRGRKKSST